MQILLLAFLVISMSNITAQAGSTSCVNEIGQPFMMGSCVTSRTLSFGRLEKRSSINQTKSLDELYLSNLRGSSVPFYT